MLTKPADPETPADSANTEIIENVKDDQTSLESNTEGENAVSAKFDWKKELRDWAIIIVAAFALAWAITHFVIIKTEIISGSMISTLNVDDRVVANRLAYVFSKPQRGDIIFFAFPDDESKTYVKRIIGLPGDKVEIIRGKVYINDSDEPLEEPYLKEKMKKEDFGPYYVPEGSYFVMGDNRNISVDSRYWDNKFVNNSQIYGKAWLRYRPNIQIIRGAEYPEDSDE
ncbi:MAG: signal peptidase I [Lachnospiraceae bacterium]|nr:signal peptidase I [Lachnospiraceae bacterium]